MSSSFSALVSLVVCVALAVAGPAHANASVENAPATSVDAKAQSNIHELIAAARREATLIEGSPGYGANAPATASEDELKIRRFYVRETLRSYDSVLRNDAHAQELQRSLDELRRQGGQLTGMPGGPPYSVLVTDRLAQELDLAKNGLSVRKTRLELTRSMRDSLSQSTKSSAASLRRLEEEGAKVAAGARSASDWQIELARTRLRSQAAILRSLESAEAVANLEIAIAEANLDLASRKLASTAGQRVFPESDYQRIRAELALESKAVTAEMTRAVDADALAAERHELARHQLAQAEAQAATKPLPDEHLEALRRTLQATEFERSTATAILETVRFKPGVQELKRVIWEYRYRLYQERTPLLIAETRAMVEDQSRKLDALARIAERHGTALKAEISETGQVAASALSGAYSDTLPALGKPGKALMRDNERERTLRQLTAFYATTQFLLARLREEVRNDGETESRAERIARIEISGRKALGDLWEFEIFAIEDTIEVDGEKVTSLTSITVGKVVRAVVIFSVGVLISYWLGIVAESLVVRRFGFDAARARILRKWLFALGLLVLLLAVLLWVHIPLTIFAFLGGAIAIGLGFGMRNLLQNLISGLMLLFERPFKPGDLVEVGGVRGSVVEIGFRSSVIRDINGVDYLIPNSTFIEQNVTNWTYENPKVRFCISVGIAYGAPVELAARVLAECVERHDLVLSDPTPEILFEDFGDDALKFSVYYWLELGPRVVARKVASDLRFMIEKTLREAGIVIPFAQRDVHLDAATPLRVQMIKE